MPFFLPLSSRSSSFDRLPAIRGFVSASIPFRILFRYYRTANDDYVYREKRGERGASRDSMLEMLERETRWKYGGNLSSAVLAVIVPFFQKIAMPRHFFLILTLNSKFAIPRFVEAISTKTREEREPFFFITTTFKLFKSEQFPVTILAPRAILSTLSPSC